MIRTKTRSRLQVQQLEARDVPALAFALSNNSLITFDTNTPTISDAPVAVTGLNAGDNLVGIDFRPQNGFLYGLGYNAGAGTAQLYAIGARTGFATPIGTTGTFLAADGVTPVPIAGTNFGFDFNPTVDRIRVVNDAGQNFRLDPNTGAFVDGNLGGAVLPGLNMDGAINGPVTAVDAAAYTNNAPNVTLTTLYTLNATANALYIQNPPNPGTQTGTLGITLNGAALDFTAANGFDIPPGVDVTASNAAATGRAFAALTVGTETRLYGIELSTGVATDLGTIGDGTPAIQGLAATTDLGGLPAIGLSADGTQLVRFNTATPATGTTVAVGAITAGEVLVGIDFRPQTGQLFGLGVNEAANTGTLYRIDPQNGGVTVIGVASSVAFLLADGITPVDFPASTVGYGFDFNPTVDRIRVVTGSGLNFRLNPNAPGGVVVVDGDPVGLLINPDGGINGPVTGVESAAYTNSFGQTLTGGVTTLYTLSAVGDALYIQNLPNAGTQTATILITLNGAPLDFTAVNGFDIPAEIRVGANNAAATGRAFALLTVGGATRLYSIDLTTGAATALGTSAAGPGGLALGDGPIVGLNVATRNLAVGGSLNGQAQVFAPNAAGQYASTPVATLAPFAGFAGSIRTAVGDVNADGIEDTVLVTGPGTPIQFAVISGADNTTVLIPPTAPFAGSESFAGGGFVAAGDLDGDGRAEVVVTPDQGGGPRVTIFSRAADGTLTVRANFFGIDDPNFRGGARAALGDVNRDGTLDLAVAAGFLGGPRIALFNGASLFTSPTRLIGDFFAFPGTDATNLRNGAFVALGDVSGDGFADLIFGGGPGGAPRVFILSGATSLTAGIAAAQAAPVANFFVAGNSTDRGGVRVAAKNADGDAQADLVVGSGEGTAANVRVYLGKNFTSSSEPTAFQDLPVFGGGTLFGGVFVG